MNELLDRYRKALEFYADSRNWMERMAEAKAGNQMCVEGGIVPWAHDDEGLIAREALGRAQSSTGDAPGDATLEHLLTRMVGK